MQLASDPLSNLIVGHLSNNTLHMCTVCIHSFVCASNGVCMWNIVHSDAGKVKTTGEIYKHKMQVNELPQAGTASSVPEPATAESETSEISSTTPLPVMPPLDQSQDTPLDQSQDTLVHQQQQQQEEEEEEEEEELVTTEGGEGEQENEAEAEETEEVGEDATSAQDPGK